MSKCEKCGTEMRPETILVGRTMHKLGHEKDWTEHTSQRCIAALQARVAALTEEVKLADDMRKDAVLRAEAAIDMHRACKAQLKTAREALAKIACFDDVGAERYLDKTGTYAHFDEPSSVMQARAALAALALGTHSGSGG